METVKDWIANPHAGEVWVHGLDLLSSLLRFDPGASAFKNAPQFDQGELDEFRKNIEAYKPDMELAAAVEEVFSRPRRRSRARLEREGDDLNVDAYLEAGADVAGARVWDVEERVADRKKQAVSVILEGAVAWVDRGGPLMARRQRQAYEVALRCEAEGRPCRVVAAMSIRYLEWEQAVDWFVVIKDYDEPIFPALWGALRDSKTCNTMWRLVSAFVVGSRDKSHGRARAFAPCPGVPETEAVIVGADALRYLKVTPGMLTYPALPENI